jgi:hypothetical protein
MNARAFAAIARARQRTRRLVWRPLYGFAGLWWQVQPDTAVVVLQRVATRRDLVRLAACDAWTVLMTLWAACRRAR